MLAKTVLNRHYADFRSLVMDLADILRRQVESIDAAVVQVDEANLPGSPQDGPLAAEAINHVLSGVRGEKAVHLCFGNYGGQTIQKGFYRQLLPFFNALNCNHLVLEFARRIEQAAKVLGPERIRWVHPDCGFWMLPRSVADRKMRALVEGRDLCQS